MSLRIRPGKATCAGIVGIMLVLPAGIWRGSDAAPARARVRIVRDLRREVPAPARSQTHPIERDETQLRSR